MNTKHLIRYIILPLAVLAFGMAACTSRNERAREAHVRALITELKSGPTVDSTIFNRTFFSDPIRDNTLGYKNYLMALSYYQERLREAKGPYNVVQTFDEDYVLPEYGDQYSVYVVSSEKLQMHLLVENTGVTSFMGLYKGQMLWQ